MDLARRVVLATVILPWRRREPRTLGVGVALLAIVAAIGAGLVESVKDTAKTLAARTMTWGTEFGRGHLPSRTPASRQKCCALHPGGSTGRGSGRLANQIHSSIPEPRSRSGLQRAPSSGAQCRPYVEAGGSSDVWRQREAAEAIGREWLKQSGTGLLIWGEVAGRDKVLRINFLLSEGETTKRPKESYTLSESLELSPDFNEDLGVVVVARAGASLVRLASNTEGLVPDLLEEIYPRLTAIGANPVVAQSKASCDWKLTIAVAQMVLGDGKRDNNRLLEAIATSRSLVVDDRCAVDRDAVAAANFFLGSSLRMLGDRESGTARFEEAITAFVRP